MGCFVSVGMMACVEYLHQIAWFNRQTITDTDENYNYFFTLQLLSGLLAAICNATMAVFPVRF